MRLFEGGRRLYLTFGGLEYVSKMQCSCYFVFVFQTVCYQ